MVKKIETVIAEVALVFKGHVGYSAMFADVNNVLKSTAF